MFYSIYFMLWLKFAFGPQLLGVFSIWSQKNLMFSLVLKSYKVSIIFLVSHDAMAFR